MASEKVSASCGGCGCLGLLTLIALVVLLVGLAVGWWKIPAAWVAPAQQPPAAPATN